MQAHHILEWVDSSTLAMPVSRLLGVNEATITGWSSERLVGGAGEGLGVWRQRYCHNGRRVAAVDGDPQGVVTARRS